MGYMTDTTNTVIEAPAARYVHELCADMRGFGDGAVYVWFAREARAWDDERTAEQFTTLTTEPVGTPGHNERVYDWVLALARRRGLTVRASDGRALPPRDIHVWGGAIAVSAYANLTTLQWVVLTALFMARVVTGTPVPPTMSWWHGRTEPPTARCAPLAWTTRTRRARSSSKACPRRR